jgi:hypothetical protein
MLEINNPEMVREVTAAFMRYEHALVTNNIEELNELFWNSEHALRFGVTENLYGYEQICCFRAKRPAIDLTRRLMNTVITTYGREMATVNTEFQRTGSSLTGRQSHVWLRANDGWRIAAAHVSLLPAAAPAKDSPPSA